MGIESTASPQPSTIHNGGPKPTHFPIINTITHGNNSSWLKGSGKIIAGGTSAKQSSGSALSIHSNSNSYSISNSTSPGSVYPPNKHYVFVPKRREEKVTAEKNNNNISPAIPATNNPIDIDRIEITNDASGTSSLHTTVSITKNRRLTNTELPEDNSVLKFSTTTETIYPTPAISTPPLSPSSSSLEYLSIPLPISPATLFSSTPLIHNSNNHIIIPTTVATSNSNTSNSHQLNHFVDDFATGSYSTNIPTIDSSNSLLSMNDFQWMDGSIQQLLGQIDTNLLSYPFVTGGEDGTANSPKGVPNTNSSNNNHNTHLDAEYQSNSPINSNGKPRTLPTFNSFHNFSMENNNNIINNITPSPLAPPNFTLSVLNTQQPDGDAILLAHHQQHRIHPMMNELMSQQHYLPANRSYDHNNVPPTMGLQENQLYSSTQFPLSSQQPRTDSRFPNHSSQFPQPIAQNNNNSTNNNNHKNNNRNNNSSNIASIYSQEQYNPMTSFLQQGIFGFPPSNDNDHHNVANTNNSNNHSMIGSSLGWQ